jgi:putative acetyltransferase
VEIAPAGPADLADCRALLEEYQRALGVSLCFQGFDQELASLPGDYAPPRGGLWIAREGGEPAGCVALRAIDAHAAELKRLYVKPAMRGRALGRELALTALDAARRAGYREVKLDTLPSMGRAQALYSLLGFRDTGPYNDNPVEGVRFMALDLGATARAS